MESPQSTVLLCVSVLVLCLAAFASATVVSSDSRAITIDGKHRILFSGSIHYPRSTAEMWPDLIRKGKEGGLDAIETYVFWNVHEPSRRQYDFTGNLDLVRFIQSIQDAGLYAILRIGPYVCAEWNYGGFPMWLHNMPGIKLRTNNDVYMNEMQNFTTLIVNMMKENNLFASQGGPIILAQIENEFGNVESSYGDGAKAYVDWCANMAVSQNIGVPWLMCQQSDAPKPMINTCNGFYCDQFTPEYPDSPKIWTENWVGWFKSWGAPNPHRTAEDVAYAVARFFQLGGSLQNYYMYHGGTNFERTAGGPYITTTYDYDAPLNEYGSLNQPKYGHLKQLHDVLHSLEEYLTEGNVTSTDLGQSVTATVFSLPGRGESCFFSNTDSASDASIYFQGQQYHIPAWSVSILPNCHDVEYNTAQVNAQTSVMVMKPNGAEDEPASFNWTWRPENLDRTTVLGKGDIFTNQIVDQKTMADDASDYLWYMTSVNIKSDDPVLTHNMSIRVNATGQILHAYVNGQYIGSEWAKYETFNYVLEKEVKLNPGKNSISLLSATIGFQNYGPHYDEVANGIAGPVEIVGRNGDETISKDISNHKWVYRVGLEGFDDQYYNPDSPHPQASKWSPDSLPINRMMTWYKTTFKAPLGTDPVVLDAQGLGKGMAWVNGHSLGRYWPSFIAQEDGCTDTCDYRGSYGSHKCQNQCGEPTQRWYHVPRSFLNDDVNTLVLFEEFGGNPTGVSFQTVTVGSVCANVLENKTMELDCNGKSISAIKFASFGNPGGSCGSFAAATCDSAALNYVQTNCVGKESCTIDVSAAVLGTPQCQGARRLAVEATC